MSQPQQHQQLRFQEKKIKDQSQTIAEQRKLIDEWIKQQTNPKHTLGMHKSHFLIQKGMFFNETFNMKNR